MQPIIVPIFKDNYAYIIPASDHETIVIDPGEAESVIEALESMARKATHIINTHHHWDHKNGNPQLAQKYGCEVFAPEKERDNIPHITYGFKDGETLEIGNIHLQVIETPGHTMGGCCLYDADNACVYTGDTLFIMGCGRLFEGTPRDMWNSFQKLKALPDETKVYCGHEYTLANAAFCMRVEPENKALKARYAELKELRRAKQPTVPSTIQDEKETNLFFNAPSAQDFALLRALKDKG